MRIHDLHAWTGGPHSWIRAPLPDGAKLWLGSNIDVDAKKCSDEMKLTDEQREALRTLSRLIVAELEVRRAQTNAAG